MQHDVIESVKTAVHHELAVLPLRPDVRTDGPSVSRAKEQSKVRISAMHVVAMRVALYDVIQCEVMQCSH